MYLNDHAGARRCRTCAGSAIINTGSEIGIFSVGTLLDYSANKGAIHAWTKVLATNLAPPVMGGVSGST